MPFRSRCVPLFALLWAAPAAAQRLEIRFLDVGQADAALIITPERRAVLVDAGRSGRVPLAALRALGIDTLDLAVASHHHDDHVGGMGDVLRGIPVRNYLDNGAAGARGFRLREQLLRDGVRYLQATRRTITLGSVRLRVLAPPDTSLHLPAEEQNNRSVGVLVEYGSFRALLTGDSEVEELGYWLAFDSVPSVRVLKAAHHGSANGVTPSWMARTAPGVVVVSVAARNRYGHPAVSVIAGWCAAGAAVLRTDQNGTVTLSADSTGEFSVSVAGRRGARAAPSSPGPDLPVVNACEGRR